MSLSSRLINPNAPRIANSSPRLQRIADSSGQSHRVKSDGFAEDSPVFAFQAEVERLAMYDGNALSSVLAMARNLNDSLSLDQLRAAYRAIAK